MALTASIAVNVVLAIAVILGLLWLLAHQGIWRGTHHDRRAMLRMRMKERTRTRRGLSSRSA